MLFLSMQVERGFHISLGIALGVMLLAPSVMAAGSGIDDAFRAYRQKDYKTAFAIAQPLAAKNNTDAQWLLGVLYRDGAGVPVNFRAALSSFIVAAEQGHPQAQFDLGGMYLLGQGVPSNRFEAYVWFSLALGSGVGEARELVEKVLPPNMTSEELRAARVKIQMWQPMKP